MNDSWRHSVKSPSYGKVSKCPQRINQNKLIFSGNFTQHYKHFNITMPERDSMRQGILNSVLKRTESIMLERDCDGMNPLYEDPRDVIGEKPTKPPRKRNIQGLGLASPRTTKEGRSQLKEQKRKLTRKYEGLITALMEKCEEHAVLISEKESQVTKLKEKLKAVLEYNRLFADENDRLKAEHATLMSYADECKRALKEEQDRCKTLEERVRQYQVPDREHAEPQSTTIPLVEVCMSCSSRQIVLNQAREQNCGLQRDMQALKDVLYRLNVQLSRYQEKLRANVPNLTSDIKDVYKPSDRFEAFDSLITNSLGQRQATEHTEESHSNKTGVDEETHTTRVVDLSGLLSAQALAPLFDAYQENLQEKDNLILDYEKQFEAMNKKSKQIVTENKSLNERITSLEKELGQVRQSYKKVIMEKETADIEKITLHERAEKAESKLKEVYELYEDKMAAMMRDYETVHREYYLVKSALEASAGKMAALDDLRARTVPADLHERRLDHCKRLLEELKHQYSMETERKTEQLKKTQEELRRTEEKYNKLCTEHDSLKEELAAALKNAKLYRRAAVVFRHRARSAAARATRVKRTQRVRSANNEPLRRALEALERIKLEIKAVKARAHSSLEELERRIVQQERRAALTQAECRRELERAALALEHKEGIIRSLIDKVADVEEVRLSQTNTHRLQGIVSDSSSDRSRSPKNQEKKETNPKPSVKLVPGPGGYYQERDGKRSTKS